MDKVYKVDKLEFLYSSKADVLYISFGKPKPAIGEETDEGFILRFDAKTNELVGVTIPFFKEVFGMPKEIHIDKPEPLNIKIPKEILAA